MLHSPDNNGKAVNTMGFYIPRRLRRPLLFLFRASLLAVVLTLLRHLFLGDSQPNLMPSPPAPLSKALVVASITTHAEQREWLNSIPSDWTVHTYVTDEPISPDLSVPTNKGNEAMVYLTYIIDNYDMLPDIVFFHHDHLKAWHQSMTSLEEVANLRPEYVVKAGFASARCLPGCENVIPLSPYTVEDDLLPDVGRDIHLTTLLVKFLDEAGGEVIPDKLAAPCCAQFAVSRDAIRARSLEWWISLRQWLIDVPLPDLNSGRLLEWTWHVFFGQEAHHCPGEKECLCHVFGKGDCDEIFKTETTMVNP